MCLFVCVTIRGDMEEKRLVVLSPLFIGGFAFSVVGQPGIEPGTYGLGNRRSVQLSYYPAIANGRYDSKYLLHMLGCI